MADDARPRPRVRTIRCRQCAYDLRGLGPGDCPECGRAFDPANPATVRTPRSTWRSVYDVYEHPSGARAAVKDGFSWPAFGFTVLWAMSRGLWTRGLALLFAGLAVAGLLMIVRVELAPDEPEYRLRFLPACLAAAVLASLVIGALGNRWRRRTLAARGYRRVASVETARWWNPTGRGLPRNAWPGLVRAALALVIVGGVVAAWIAWDRVVEEAAVARAVAEHLP